MAADEIYLVNPDDERPTERIPQGCPPTGPDAVADPAGYPETILFRVSNIYLADITGPALHLGANTVSADIVAENINIDGADYGIIADGVRIIVRDSDIIADEPFGVVNGGEIEHENTNTGEDADPTVPETCPTSAEDAAGSNTQL